LSPENKQLLEDFGIYLFNQGHRLQPTKQWEAMRWESPAGDGARIMYTDKKGTIGRRFGDDRAREDWAAFLEARAGMRPTALVYDDECDLSTAFEISLEGCDPEDETLRPAIAEAVASFGRQAANLAQGAALQGLRISITSTPKGVHIIVNPTSEMLEILKGTHP